jgi:hypothetical protein
VPGHLEGVGDQLVDVERDLRLQHALAHRLGAAGGPRCAGRTRPEAARWRSRTAGQLVEQPVLDGGCQGML